MKNFSTQYYNNVIASELTSIATCFRIELQDGRILGFTTNVRSVVFEDEPFLIYETASASKTAFSSTNTMAVDNIDATILLDSDKITKEDLEKGVYDNSKIRVFRFDYSIKPYSYTNIDKVTEGIVGEVTRNKNSYSTEFRSKTQYMQNTVVNVVAPTCRAILGDSKCRKDLTDFTFLATINTVNDFTTFTIDLPTSKEDHYFAYGNVEFLTGKSSGLVQEIKDNTGNSIKLQLPSVYTFSIGDQVKIIAGCDKKKNTCKDKFNNVVNFRGFSFVPGLDNLISG